LYVIKHADIRSILNTLVRDKGESELEKVEYYELQIEALAVFQELVLAADARSALIKFGLQKVLGQMMQLKDDSHIQLEGCIMLERLALYPEALGADWAKDALDVLIQAIRTHVHHPLLREEAITAILYLTRTDENRVVMKKEYGERTLALLFAQCTRDHPDRPRLCINAWGLISEFSPQYFDALVVEQFREGAPTAVRMLTDPPLDLIGPLEAGVGELQSAACDVLRILLPLNECLEFAELDIVTAVVGAMRGLPMHEELQYKSCIVLGQATNNETNVKLLLGEATIGAICNSLNNWKMSIDVCREGFQALSNIGAWEAAHRQISHEGALDSYMSLVGIHVNCEEVMAPACSMLENIVSDEIVRIEVLQKGLTSVPLNSLEKFPGNRDIVCALQKLAVWPELRNVLTAAGAVERVGRVMRPFIGSEMEHEYHDLLIKLQLESGGPGANDSD